MHVHLAVADGQRDVLAGEGAQVWNDAGAGRPGPGRRHHVQGGSGAHECSAAQ
jgi:hypothetical protein